MADIALFHSALGVRPGIDDAAGRLRAAGHAVVVVDQYEGRTFDDYESGSAHTDSIGFPELMRRAVDGVAGLADGFVALGFSNGAGMAEHVALQRQAARVVLVAGALPLAMLDADAWPAGTAAQLHGATGDPFVEPAWVDAVAGAVEASGAPLERFDYPVDGHLFMDPSLPAEHDPEATERLWERVLAFCGAA